MKKKSILVILVSIISVILLFFIFTYDKLKTIGYSKTEIEYIRENLNDKEIDKLLEIKYDKKIIEILKNKDYKIDYINRYLIFINTYNLDIDRSIYYVNNDIEFELIKELRLKENYNEDKVLDYYKFKKEHNLDDETTLYIINNNIEYNDNVKSYMAEKYFILDNLNRYLNYNKGNLSYSNVVKLVNSNRDKTFYTDATTTDLSKGYLLIVNKYYGLDKNYVPSNLVSLPSTYTDNYCRLEQTTYNQFKKLVADAKKEGLNIICRSGYRSYNDQSYIYNSYVRDNGLTWANQYSAKPGYSEHQTGLAIDVAAAGGNYGIFANSKEFVWIKNNAHKYGFILRYLSGEENITGYNYESWHYRYVGVDAATQIFNEKITYEEYYEYYVK